MFEKFSRSWSLVKASAAVLRADKELLLFPSCPASPRWWWSAPSSCRCSPCACSRTASASAGAIWGFLFYLCQYFVIFFFNAALVERRDHAPRGRRPDRGGRLAMPPRSRIVPILGYAAIAATVGMLLQALEEQATTSWCA